MASEYQLVATLPGMTMQTVLRVQDQAYIPDDPANRDWQQYQQWLADGGVPDPVPVPPEPPPPAPVELPADPTEDMHAATKGYVDTEVAAVRAQAEAIEARIP